MAVTNSLFYMMNQVAVWCRVSGVLEAAVQSAIAPLVKQIETLTATVERLQQTVEDLTPAKDRLWSYVQVAKKCEVSASTVRSWASRKQIETVLSTDGQPRIPDTELKRLLLNGARPTKRMN